VIKISFTMGHEGQETSVSPAHTAGKNTVAFINEPARRVSVVREPDVLAVGAGPAGFYHARLSASAGLGHPFCRDPSSKGAGMKAGAIQHAPASPCGTNGKFTTVKTSHWIQPFF
jgi:hypothetical protein